jgi:hypothetical protein
MPKTKTTAKLVDQLFVSNIEILPTDKHPLYTFV